MAEVCMQWQIRSSTASVTSGRAAPVHTKHGQRTDEAGLVLTRSTQPLRLLPLCLALPCHQPSFHCHHTWKSDSSCCRFRCSLSRRRLHTVPSPTCLNFSQCSCLSRRFCSAVAACSSREVPGRCERPVGERCITKLGVGPPAVLPFAFSVPLFLPREPGGGGGGGGGGPPADAKQDGC